MDNIKGAGLDPVRTNEAARKVTSHSLSAESRFLDILALMQNDGLIAKDAPAQSAQLTEAQAAQLRQAFDIGDMAPYASKRALLNELVSLGVLSAEESELSMHQVLPPQDQNFQSIVGTGSAGLLGGAALWQQSSRVQDMLSEPNYLEYLRQAIELDGVWSRPQDVKDARAKVYDVLNGIFGTG